MFSQYEGVSVRYASKPGELEGADMIILPGTKSTLGDMRWLRESGMEAMIKKLNFGGVPVFGVCGGYQMLGRRISDPENTEGGGEAAGMGLLDCETVFRSEKTRTRISGKIQSIGGFFSFLSDRDFRAMKFTWVKRASAEMCCLSLTMAGRTAHGKEMSAAAMFMEF